MFETNTDNLFPAMFLYFFHYCVFLNLHGIVGDSSFCERHCEWNYVISENKSSISSSFLKLRYVLLTMQNIKTLFQFNVVNVDSFRIIPEVTQDKFPIPISKPCLGTQNGLKHYSSRQIVLSFLSQFHDTCYYFVYL